MNQRIFVLMTLLVLVPAFSKALTGKEFLQKIQTNYQALKTLELNLTYDLYKGHEGTDVVESYTSMYAKNEDVSYRKINQTELINTRNYYINVSHETQTIFVSDPSDLEIMDGNIKSSLKRCRDVIVNEIDRGKRLTLLLKGITDLPYARIEVEVNNKYWIEKVTFFYANEVNFSGSSFDKEMARPKLVVTYGDLKKRWKDDGNIGETDRFFTERIDGIELSEAYKNYHVIDLREKK